LLQTPVEEISHLQEEGYLVLTEGPAELFEAIHPDEAPSLEPSALVPVAVLLGTIAVAALGLFPIYIAALGGVVTMVAGGYLSASRAYDAVSWNVVFLLAGLLPLGLAMQATGGAALLGGVLVDAAGVLPPLALLALFDLGAAGQPFLLVVTFAVATAFLTPIGYQTNLMVYGPGGYRFTDYARVGLPLQLLLCVVTTLSVAALWPL
jgi:di/tricarboxylate transporter